MTTVIEAAHVAKAAEKMRARACRVIQDHVARTTPYDVVFGTMKLRVDPQVFSPIATPSTALLAEHLVVKEDDRVLDMGTGSGALAAVASERTLEKVLAVDISPHAVACARGNVAALRADVDVRISDVFGTIEHNERFSLIIFNPPFVDAEAGSFLERSVFDRRHATLERFLRDAPTHLSIRGRIVTIFGGNEEELALERIARRYGYTVRVLADLWRDIHFGVFELTRV